MPRFDRIFLVLLFSLLLVTPNLEAERPLTMLDFHGTEYSDTSFEDEDYASEWNEVHHFDISLKLAYPIQMGDNFKLIPGFDFQREQFSYFIDNQDYKGYEDHLPRHYRSIYFNISTRVGINEEWGFATRAALGIEGDYEDTSAEDMRAKGTATVNYKFDEDSEIFFGGEYDTIFGDAFFYPVLGFWWMPNDLFYFNTVLPRFIEVAWTPGERFHLGLEGNLNGKYYRLSDDPDKSFIESGRVRERYIKAGVFSEFRVVKHLFIRASAGVSFDHRYKFYDMDDDDLLFDGDLESSAYLQVGIHWTTGGPFEYFE